MSTEHKVINGLIFCISLIGIYFVGTFIDFNTMYDYSIIISFIVPLLVIDILISIQKYILPRIMLVLDMMSVLGLLCFYLMLFWGNFYYDFEDKTKCIYSVIFISTLYCYKYIIDIIMYFTDFLKFRKERKLDGRK